MEEIEKEEEAKQDAQDLAEAELKYAALMQFSPVGVAELMGEPGAQFENFADFEAGLERRDPLLVEFLQRKMNLPIDFLMGDREVSDNT